MTSPGVTILTTPAQYHQECREKEPQKRESRYVPRSHECVFVRERLSYHNEVESQNTRHGEKYQSSSVEDNSGLLKHVDRLLKTIYVPHLSKGTNLLGENYPYHEKVHEKLGREWYL